MSRKQKRRPEQGHKRTAERSLGECISAVARAVIVQQQPLRSAWRQYCREHSLRDLLDGTVDFQTDQLHWSTRRDGVEQIQPAVVLGTPWLDVRISILPPSWQRLPLFQQGQAIWTQKLSPEIKPRN